MLLKIIEWINKKTYSYLKGRYGVVEDTNHHTKRRRRSREGIRVTDRALIRYFERFEGYDIDSLYNTISAGVDVRPGLSRQRYGDMIIISNDGTVVTVFKDSNRTSNSIRGVDKLINP